MPHCISSPYPTAAAVTDFFTSPLFHHRGAQQSIPRLVDQTGFDAVTGKINLMQEVVLSTGTCVICGNELTCGSTLIHGNKMVGLTATL